MPSTIQPASSVDPAGVPARRAALRLLDAVLRRGQPLESALHGATQGLRESADRGLVHAIAGAVLRHLPDLDALIDSATRQNLAPDSKARAALRIALAQALALGTPPHAAIATVLPLVDGGPRRLVHGVLGTLLRSGVGLPDPPTLPAPLALRWQVAWGEPVLEATSRALAGRPATDISLKDDSATSAWAERLGGVSLATGHVRLPADTAITSLPGFDEGDWWVQDLAASLPARMLGEGEGRTALDLCAAPGGKTMQLAAAGWQVTAVDQSRARMERLAANLARTGLTARQVVADLLSWEPDAPVDAILLDAPCSATGIFRRHPDVIHRVNPRLIGEMAELQARLLERAWHWLRPSGTLVYATCSLEPAEGEAQIAALMAAAGDALTLVPADADSLPDGLSATTQGWLRTLPGHLENAGGLDGFFTAKVRRSS
jgi:16S rRNA (cytosine967-C5)-methyltransferase